MDGERFTSALAAFSGAFSTTAANLCRQGRRRSSSEKLDHFDLLSARVASSIMRGLVENLATG